VSVVHSGRFAMMMEFVGFISGVRDDRQIIDRWRDYNMDIQMLIRHTVFTYALH
jgi:hypothetical protein